MNTTSTDSPRGCATTPPISPMYIGAIAAILVVAFLLRIYDLGTQELWLDETRSWYMTTVARWVGPRSMGENNTPPLYYLLLRAWSRIAGDSPVALRLPSAFFGTLFVGAAIWAGREIFNGPVGLWSGVFAALSPMQIYYSQEARSYALLMLLLMLTYGLLFRALETNRRLWWIGYGISSVLSLYSHYIAVLGLAPAVLMALAWPTQRMSRWAHYCGTTVVSGILLVPWLAASFYFTEHVIPEQIWMKLLWEKIPPSMAVIRSLELFGLGGRNDLFGAKQFAMVEFSAQLGWLGIGALLVIGIVAVVPYADSRLAIAFLRERKVWLVASLLVPLFALWAASYLTKPVYVLGRYDMVAFPAYVLLIGLGLSKCVRLPRIGLIVGPSIGALLFTVTGTKLLRYYGVENPDSGARKVVSWIDTKVMPGDVVVVTHDFGLPVRYHLGQRGYQCDSGYCSNQNNATRFSFGEHPVENEKDPLGVHGRRFRVSGQELRKDVRRFLKQLDGPDNSLWVVARYKLIRKGKKIRLTAIENDLAREIERHGFHGKFVNASPLIMRFNRSP